MLNNRLAYAVLIFGHLLLSLSAPWAFASHSCQGAKNCHVCTNCHACKWCNSSKTPKCGVYAHPKRATWKRKPSNKTCRQKYTNRL
jgi:hypothetical protein